MKTLARLLVRPGQEIGVLVPMKNHGLKPGLYDLREVLGEHMLVWKGEPYADWSLIAGLSPSGICNDRSRTLMTTDEQPQKTYNKAWPLERYPYSRTMTPGTITPEIERLANQYAAALVEYYDVDRSFMENFKNTKYTQFNYTEKRDAKKRLDAAETALYIACRDQAKKLASYS